MTHKEVEEYILSMPNARLDYPFGEGVAVYKVNNKMFALIPEGKDPVSLSLKCDPGLAKLLREKYESIMEGYHLNKKHWNTMLLTGQLGDERVKDLIRHSYNLVINNHIQAPDFS
jgi:predicted DNA-binding protein (MmcQ/YjbR family)